MGLLSGILTAGGAAAGFALGGPGGAKLGASLGGAVGGALAQSGAVKKASKAQIAAEQAALQARKDAAAKVEGIQAPALATYGAGINALSGRLGIQPAPSAAPAVAPAGFDGGEVPPAGQVYGGKTPGGFAGVSPVETNALTGAPAGSTYQGGVTPSPQPAAAQQPAGVDPGTYGNANPNYTPSTYTAPADFKYGLDEYKASPGYQYQQDEARKSILASASATGALQSGAALKELQDRAQNIAYQDFTGERAFAANRSDVDRTFHRTDYADTRDFDYGRATADRNYLTNRFDQGTNDLFRYTGIGQNAAGIVGNAALGVGLAGSDAALGIGNAKAGNALQQGNIGAGLAGDVAGSLASYFNGPNALAGTLKTAAAKNPYLF